MIYENDRLTLTGSTTQLERFFIKIGILSERTVNEVMIVGGVVSHIICRACYLNWVWLLRLLS